MEAGDAEDQWFHITSIYFSADLFIRHLSIWSRGFIHERQLRTGSDTVRSALTESESGPNPAEAPNPNPNYYLFFARVLDTDPDLMWVCGSAAGSRTGRGGRAHGSAHGSGGRVLAEDDTIQHTTHYTLHVWHTRLCFICIKANHYQVMLTETCCWRSFHGNREMLTEY